MTRFFQLLFWFAVLATLFFTLRPITYVVPGSDKTQHLISFGALMLLGGAAFPRARLLPLAAALSGLGAAIELLQPLFRRNDDLLDWIADTAGIVIALLFIWAVRKLVLRRAG